MDTLHAMGMRVRPKFVGIGSIWIHMAIIVSKKVPDTCTVVRKYVIIDCYLFFYLFSYLMIDLFIYLNIYYLLIYLVI